MNSKFFAVVLFAVAVESAPTADAGADADAGAQYIAPKPHAGPFLPAAAAAGAARPVGRAALTAPLHVTSPNCKVDNEILVTQSCVPTPESVCTTETVDTEEIEYEKVCKNVVDTICDHPPAPAAGPLAAATSHLAKRDAVGSADADADANIFHGGVVGRPAAAVGPAGVVPVAHVAPVVNAVAHSAVATIKHACHEVTTEHCVDNPKVKVVPVEVRSCHTVTRVKCSDVENPLPKTTCEPVETKVSLAHPVPVPAHAPAAHHAPAAVHHAPAGYARK